MSEKSGPMVDLAQSGSMRSRMVSFEETGKVSATGVLLFEIKNSSLSDETEEGEERYANGMYLLENLLPLRENTDTIAFLKP